ncbi:pyrroline-5-carboxylate reductase [Dehalogenimonas etheniformans]|uniref:Pyrroline-5-carboxylate reductase n=1 Tax=Dehalogenimonas etheniformans TaxID=1536648 RepID=A0A2P5P7T4_9CHLR|nr:pyrroline-5-carboxylate reductase [Dehalogenimonas etheniformans]PPD58346.1 pyrroline-5-carboxylate reductase [Dehalogenimonas etheniformans]QNT76918.1 pyrroline-5-carboxylate reductase [Dehalogenimonas etheniformans]
MKIAFIGGGNMGRAMISAIIDKGLAEPEDITVADVKEESREAIVLDLGVFATPSNLAAVKDAEVIILAIKPQNLADVTADLAGKLDSCQLVLSIIAGKKISTLVDGFKHRAVVRVMPNTPAQIGRGMSVWTATEVVSPKQKESTQKILTAMGQELFTPDENDLDKATALSGSGPAYFFLFMEALVDAGVKMGFSPEVARQLVLQTASGSAEYACLSGRDLMELRRMVTSPGGTTAEAIKVFESGDFKGLVNKAVEAALRRAKELGV